MEHPTHVRLRGEKGSYTQVLDLAYPVVLSMLSWTVLWTIDTIFVGRLGTAEQGAVGFAGAVNWTMMTLVSGTLIGIQVYVAQHFGRKEYARCGELLWQGLYLALLAGIPSLAMGLWGGGLVRHLGVAPELEPHAYVYFRIRMAGGLFIFLTFACDGLFRGVGDTKTPMKIAIVATLTNVVLDYGLIFGKLGLPRMEVAGAAWATVIATVVQAALSLLVVLRSRRYRESFATLPVQGFRARELWDVLRVGGPVGLQWVLDMGSWTVFTTFLARLGAVPAAANQIAITLLHVSFMPGVAVSTAATTLVGQYMGASDPSSARKAATRALRIAVLFMGMMGIVFLLFRRPLIRLFNPDPEVLAIGADLLVFAAFFQVFDAASMVSSGVLRGSGDTKVPAIIQIVLSWFFFLPLVYLVVVRMDYGARGGWATASLYVVLLGIALYSRYRRGRWADRVLLHEGGRPGEVPPPGPECIGPVPEA
jgi:MATE family multidrug resistance protein